MGNLPIRLSVASNILFAVAVLLIVLGLFFTNSFVIYHLQRVGVLLACMSVFYGIYRFVDGDELLTSLWERKSNSQDSSLRNELWLYQPAIFGALAVFLLVLDNPWIA